MDDSSSEEGVFSNLGTGFKMVTLILIMVIIFAKVYWLLSKYYYNDENNPYKGMSLFDLFIFSFDNMVLNNLDKKSFISRVQQCTMLFIVFSFLD